MSVTKHGESSGEVWIDTIQFVGDGIGATSSPYGEIRVDKIGSLGTSGDITAEVLVAGSALTGETVAIGSINCDGDLLNDVTATTDDILEINVDGNVDVVQFIQAGHNIGSIAVAGDFSAHVETGTATSGVGILNRLEVGGDYISSNIVTKTIGGVDAGVFIHGDFVQGGMYVDDGLDVPVVIDGSFGIGSNWATIEVPEYGDLRTQVVVNKANSSGSWGSNAHVCFTDEGTGVCGVGIHVPYYTLTDVVDGSIGLAPFHLHDESCTPVNGGEFGPVSNSLELSGQCLDQCEPLGASGSITQAIVRHYGPVQWASGDPLTVKRRSLACGGSETWTNVTSSFDFAIHTGSGDREIKVTYTGTGYPYWPIDYEYRIEPVASVLKCKDVDGSPDVADYDYEFSVLADCAESFLAHYDQNDDEALCGLDLVTWSASPVDLNGDTVADEADLNDLWDVVQTHGD